ncbi:MAG: hypothetical protein P4L84_17240, partial [Isosphaeraceae bacterium]|nr:hypothetical protein [Isosphaeraceae bacterium]
MSEGLVKDTRADRGRRVMVVKLALWVIAAVGAGGAGLPDVEGRLEAGKPFSTAVAAPDAARNLSVLIALKQPGRLAPG